MAVRAAVTPGLPKSDPQPSWIARRGVDPFFAYDANCVIEPGLDHHRCPGTRANRVVAIIERVTRTNLVATSTTRGRHGAVLDCEATKNDSAGRRRAGSLRRSRRRCRAERHIAVPPARCPGRRLRPTVSHSSLASTRRTLSALARVRRRKGPGQHSHRHVDVGA
jgi:hypothetical protein